MSREDANKLRYIIALIAEFAARFGLSDRQAYNYINRFKGIEYLNSFYDVLHTLTFEEAIEAIAIICVRNGGKLKYNKT